MMQLRRTSSNSICKQNRSNATHFYLSKKNSEITPSSTLILVMPLKIFRKLVREDDLVKGYEPNADYTRWIQEIHKFS